MTAGIATACSTQGCGPLLLRGDRVSFVSVEQEKRTGAHPLDDKRMPSDLVVPPGFVLASDPSGEIFDRCNFYVVRFRKGQKLVSHGGTEATTFAREYYGEGARLVYGAVDIPKGRWHRVAKVKYIRYRRMGKYAGSYEHTYEIPVDLEYSSQPLAFRIPLPEGCVVDERGFVWP